MGSLSAQAINARKLFLAKIKPGADETIKKNKDMLDSIKETLYGIDALIEKAQIAPIELHVTKVKALTAKVEASIVALDNCLAKVKDFANNVLKGFREYRDRWSDLAKKNSMTLPSHIGNLHQDKVDRLNKASKNEADRVYLDIVKETKVLEHHPGLARAAGHIGFLGHGTLVQFRNIRINQLP